MSYRCFYCSNYRSIRSSMVDHIKIRKSIIEGLLDMLGTLLEGKIHG